MTSGLAANDLTSNARLQQEAREKNKVGTFIDSIAGSIYKLAWPTAAYKSWSFADFRSVPEGYRLVIKLSGTSAFDGGDLWLKLGFLLNSTGLKDMQVIDNNAILMQPFGTIKLIGDLGAEITREYAQSHPAFSLQASSPAPPLPREIPPPALVPTRAGVVCVINGTDATLNFTYHWGTAAWEQSKLEPRMATTFSWTYQLPSQDSSPDFEIEYDDNFAAGYTPQRYLLLRRQAELPSTCDAAYQYRFSLEGTKIVLRKLN